MTIESRRDFLRAAGATLAASALMGAQEEKAIPRRVLGKSGLQVSILGLGGYHVAIQEEKDAIATVHRAIDRGVNFFDNAWEYHGGRAEEVMGKALREGGRRAKVLLMSKSRKRDREGAARQIEESLRRLQTDHLDLWQFHALSTVKDVERLWAPDGAMEAAQAALKAGKIRHVGLTGHTDPACLLRALEFEGLETIQVPVNPLDAHFMSFQKEVLAKARRNGIGVIAMKTLAMGRALTNLAYTVEEGLRYAWSLDVDVVVSGMTSVEQLEKNVSLAKSFSPMPRSNRDALVARVEPLQGTSLEWYKNKP